MACLAVLCPPAGSGVSSSGSTGKSSARGRPPRPPRVLRRRGRYVVWSAVSLVVVGIGTAAFSMGGGGSEPGPKITPQVEMFSLEHAIQTGDVPFPEPAQASTSRP